jgi:transposase
VKLIDKNTVIAVCIDDFALKKRQRYGTVMFDLETHKLVDMIESREMADVVAWLKEYPGIRVVT